MADKDISIPPELFCYGLDGVPGEFSQFVSSIDDNLRLSRGASSHTGPAIFRIDAVKVLAGQLYFEMVNQRNVKDSYPSQSKPRKLKLSLDTASVTYMLLAYCAHWKKTPPPELLWLIFEALGLKEGNPSPELEGKLGLAVGVEDKKAWLKAAALDGEADAQKKPLDQTVLARQTGISEKTLRRWRATRQYQSRRNFCAYIFNK